MHRYPVRDSRVKEGTKPRILDVIINDDGIKMVEVKDGKQKKTILLEDLLHQIEKIK